MSAGDSTAGSAAKPTEQSKGVVLVVEDDPPSRNALVAVLKYFGLEAVPASSLKEAMEQLAKTHPSMMVLDLMLPDGNGIELLRHVRNESLPIRVAVATGANDSLLLSDVAELHPDAMYRKPINMETMARWLNR